MKDRSGNDLKVGQTVTVQAIVRGVYADFAELEITGTDEEIRNANHRPVIRVSGSLVDGTARSGIDAANTPARASELQAATEASDVPNA